MDLAPIIIMFMAGVGVFWIAKVFYILQKGINEIIQGLNSLDERLSKIEQVMRGRGA